MDERENVEAWSGDRLMEISYYGDKYILLSVLKTNDHESNFWFTCLSDVYHDEL